MLRQFAAVIEQPGNQQIVGIGIAQHHARARRGWNDVDRIAKLLVGQRQSLPLSRRAAPRGSRRARGPAGRRDRQPCRVRWARSALRGAPRPPPPPARQFERLNTGGFEAKIARLSAIAVDDGAGRRPRSSSAAPSPSLSAAGPRHAHARGEAEGYGEVGRIAGGDQEAALPHELLQAFEAGPAKARPHVVGLIGIAQIRRQRRDFPGQRIPVHGHAGDDGLGVARRPAEIR